MWLFRRRHRRDPLRHCPVCTADAVSVVEREAVDESHVSLELRCGGCGTFRRVMTSTGAVELFELRLERQCLYMSELADRQERERIVGG
jgi:hypothetical protein